MLFLLCRWEGLSITFATARSAAARTSGVMSYAARISDAVAGFPMYGIFRLGFTLDINKGYLGYPPRYAFFTLSEASSALVASCSTMRPVSIT